MRSNIIVKISDADKGQPCQFDRAILSKERNVGKYDYSRGVYIFKFDPNAVVAPQVTLGKEYICIHSGYNGDPDLCGRELLDNYPDYESALNLSLVGDVWGICEQPRYEDGAVAGDAMYITPKCLDEKKSWQGTCPKMLDSVDDAEAADFTYVFDGKWKVRPNVRCVPRSGKWTNLSQYLLLYEAYMKVRKFLRKKGYSLNENGLFGTRACDSKDADLIVRCEDNKYSIYFLMKGFPSIAIPITCYDLKKNLDKAFVDLGIKVSELTEVSYEHTPGISVAYLKFV